MADGDVTLRTKLVGEDAGASRTFKELAKNVDHLHTRMIAVGTAIGNLASGGIMALGGLAVSAVKTGISTAASMQQAQIAFKTLLGSSQAAGDYLKYLQDFAAHTPFELQGLVESSRTLIGVGVSAEQAKGILQNFGDAAAAVGIDQAHFQATMIATSQAIGQGRFMTADLNQINNNGIPIWHILGQAMNKSGAELRDLASHGKLLASDVLPLLEAQMHKDYAGSLDAQAKTLSGEWSNVQDTITQGLGNAFKGLADWLQARLPAATNTLSNAMAKLPGILDKVGHDLGIIATVVNHDVVPALKFIGDHATVFATLAASAATGVATYKAFTLVMGIFTAVTTAASVAQKLYAVATREATVAQVGLDVAMDANPIGLIVAAIAALVIGLIALGVWLYKVASNSETFRNAVSATFNAVKAAVGVAVNAIMVGLRAIPGLLGAVIGWFQALPGRIMAGIVALPGLVLGLIKTMFEKLAFAVGYSLGMMVNLFVLWPMKVGQAIASLPGIVWHWITTAGVQGVKAFFNFQTSLISRAYALTGQMLSWVAALIPKVVAWFARLPGMAVSAIKALPGQIKAVFAAAGTWLLDAGRQIIAGLVSGIKGAAGAAVSAVKDLGGNLISGFAHAIDSHSPSRKMIPLGKSIVDGIEVGLRQRAPAVLNFLESFAQRIGNIKVTARVKSALEKLATDTAADMRAVTAKFDHIKDAIKAQQAKVADLIKARADYANTLAGAASGGGITNIGLLKLDDQGRNADAQQKLADAKDADAKATDNLASAQQKLQDLLAQEASRTADSVAQLQALRDARQAVTDAEVAAAAASTKLGTAQDAAKNATTNQATDFLNQLKSRAGAIHDFSNNMNRLKAEGLSQDVLQQIASAGLETGGALAQALATQGTPETIKGINAMSKEINDSTKRFGASWAGDMYDTGIKAAEGILKGMQSKESAILAMIRSLASKIVAEIKGTLGLRGGATLGGGGAGSLLDLTASTIGGNAPNWDTIISGRTAIPLSTQAQGVGRPAPTVINVHMHNGIVGDAHQVATHIGDVIRRVNARGTVVKLA